MSKEHYQKCDELDNLPALHKENWLFELEWLSKNLEQNSSVLQVGCMDGTRIKKMLELRSDLLITGLDIDSNLLEIAKRNLSGKNVSFILGDIAQELSLSSFDAVICLNNTLGYIPNQKDAIVNMKKLGAKTIISVYGEHFSDDLAKAYFSTLGTQIVSISNDIIETKDLGSVKRYTREMVESWGGEIVKTPLGYLCILPSTI